MLPISNYDVFIWYIQSIMIVYVSYDVFVIVRKCFFLLGFPFGQECYVIALNSDLLYCIFELLICKLSREERGLQGVLAAVVI